VLELAILGLLSESPMHGYELRKRLNALLGTFRAFSYGSLYPTLRKMRAAGWIATDGPAAGIGGRSKVVYELTAEGKERLAEMLDEAIDLQDWRPARYVAHDTASTGAFQHAT